MTFGIIAGYLLSFVIGGMCGMLVMAVIAASRE